ncbi:MAG TPA: ATP-binding cassette domain-containing protein, partial [Chloroflexota bacterium]|nr:ATP-binding cassette domain-containing protein [Chloroflexota bacterium]
MSALSAQGLTARYPGQPVSRPALLDVDLDLERGERLLLLGPNGAGKSTFIRVFAGLMHAARGKALVAGHPARAAREMVGVVSHATFLYDELTAAENLRLYAEL